MAFIRRALRHPVSVQALIEFALWLALPYLIFGFFWATVHGDKVTELENQLSKVSATGADLAALGEAAALWPALLLLSDACAAPGH